MTPRLTGRTGKATRPAPAGSARRLIPPMPSGSVLDPVNSSTTAVAPVPIGIAFATPPAETAWLVPGAGGVRRHRGALPAPRRRGRAARPGPFMLAGSALLPATVLPGRSLSRLGTTTTTGKA
ncbi:hypothetical protein ABB07_02835 [Streptomyces incarnatus]|uniref:Uncharacterized protein n=1 Tax=Streptomyces incarnatus TaxID=665007 RepID=A0ABM5TDU6_9ACTN|nr:hypothetical protein ABB07_02835 [Streptomyces incarnatus]